MQVIPAIDLLDGKVVRLARGDFSRVTVFGDDPIRVAEDYRRSGADRLHFVNLSAAKDGGHDRRFLQLVSRLSQIIDVQVGGGIRDLPSVWRHLEAGATAVVVGTMLFTDPDAARAAVALFGPQSIVVALDVDGEKVKILGWRKDSGSGLWDAARLAERLGIRQVLATDISRDGMGSRPNVALYAEWKRRFPGLRITASGGVRDAEDIRALEETGCDSVVVGRALLDNSVTFSSLVRACARQETEKMTLRQKNSRGLTAPGEQPVDSGDNRNLPRHTPGAVSPRLFSSFNADVPNAHQSEYGSGLAVRVIPCLDVTRGRVVKGTNFQNLRDAGDPVELARRYCDEGADELVFLDITATSDDRRTAAELASRVAEAVNIPFTIGGGVCRVADARRLLEAGADKVAVNSAAVAAPTLLEEMSQQLGVANTVCAIDARRKGGGWTVLTRGGRDDANIDAVAWAERAEQLGAGELLVTSHDQDGTAAGFDTDLLARIKKKVSVPVIASGGGGSPESFVDAVRIGGADAVLAAGVFHFGVLSISDVKTALRSAQIPIRP